MATVSATEAQRRFDELLDSAQLEPIFIERGGRIVAVMVSAKEYDGMSGKRST
jgi:prevent-host-death family protein